MTLNSGVRNRVSVVVASHDSNSPTLKTCLARFAEEVDGRGEVVLVDASRDARRFPGVRVIRGEANALAPELWRDGLRASDSSLVAFSTAAMVPVRGWLDALLARLDESGAAAVGGPIDPAVGLSATDRAVYLLRYVNYLSPLPGSAVPEPPGDNAIYRRDSLDGMEHVLDRGFWEAEIHRILRSRGQPLALAAGAVVTFHGGCRLFPTLGQRWRHARHYGAMRASGMSTAARLVRGGAAPAVPAVLLNRIAGTLRGRGRSIGSWLTSVPGLALLLAAWAAGEAWGGLTGSTVCSSL